MQQLTASKTIAANQNTLVQHTARPQWGLAVLAWQREDKRGYQFEDGQLRIFKQGYFKLLAPVVRPLDEQSRVLDELNNKLGRRRAAKRNGSGHAPIPLASQVDYFRALFPKGFQGATFAKKHRGMGAKKPLKRHRNPVMKQARELFAEDRLRAMLANGDANAIVADLLALFEATDLVTKAQVRGLDKAKPEVIHRLVTTLVELMWGDAPLQRRFDAWLSALHRALTQRASWSIATAIPALLAPSEHVAVKRTTFVRQAVWMAPNLVIDKAPSGAGYLKILEMVAVMNQKLGDAGLHARDHLDIYDFIQITLRPKAVKEITAKLQSDEPSTGETATAANDDQTAAA
ncbi:MAG: hypothetical protein KJO07_07755 [Deltaproteobacteria bacterium]|nr:hypothetical protein [Deltaproteobacteria bacterium]